MKTLPRFTKRYFFFVCLFTFINIAFPASSKASSPTLSSTKVSNNFTEYKGVVVDKKTGNALAFASIIVAGTNISTVSNTDGEYLIKIPKEIDDPKILISFIGYKNKTLVINELKSENPRIEMEAVAVSLPEFRVVSKDAEVLMRAVLDKKGDNYSQKEMLMTAFYRETIKKSRSYVSLSEAVIDIYKQPYESDHSDIVKMYKSRKKADYSKLDTIAFKLMGGPFNSLRLDVMKNPESLFTDNMLTNYEFTFDRTTHIDNRMIYIVDFKQKIPKTEPLYAGKLYIDAQTMALKTAVFDLNVENRDLTAKMFILKKPLRAEVYPTAAAYRIDYREKDGKWYYNYSRIELTMKINWKRRLFKTTYVSTIEMAVTNTEQNSDNKPFSSKERLRPSVIISDEASGFSDPEFWGEYNVIEPEKSIESAIKKIQKQLEKEK